MIDLCIEICDNYYLWGVIRGVKSVVLSRLRQRKIHHLHLFVHEVIREVRIYLSDKSVRAITHPNINDKTLVILGSSYLALVLVTSFLIVRNDILRIYLIAFAAMELLVCSSLALYYFSKSYNKNLTEFDSIYSEANRDLGIRLNSDEILHLFGV